MILLHLVLFCVIVQFPRVPRYLFTCILPVMKLDSFHDTIFIASGIMAGCHNVLHLCHQWKQKPAWWPSSILRVIAISLVIPIMSYWCLGAGPLFNERYDVLPQDFVKSRKPLDSGLDFFSRPEIWQASQQQHWWDVCQTSKQYDEYNSNKSHENTTKRELSYWFV